MDNPSLDSAPAYIQTNFICCRLGITARTLVRMVKRGSFPKPAIRIGGRPRWLLTDVRVLFPAV